MEESEVREMREVKKDEKVNFRDKLDELENVDNTSHAQGLPKSTLTAGTSSRPHWKELPVWAADTNEPGMTVDWQNFASPGISCAHITYLDLHFFLTVLVVTLYVCLFFLFRFGMAMCHASQFSADYFLRRPLASSCNTGGESARCFRVA